MASAIPVDVEKSGGRPQIDTLYEIVPSELFKTARKAEQNARVRILLPGGRRDRGDYVEDYAQIDLPTFLPGERYILFLKKRADRDDYALTTGRADSVFLVVSADRVIARGKSILSQTLAGTAYSFRATLRAAKGGSR